MKIIKKEKISKTELDEMAQKIYGNIVKAVVDVEKEILAVDADMHADLEQFLMDTEESNHWELWGINILPQADENNFIMFDSLINLKPGFGNRSMGIENEEIRKKIIKIVKSLVE